MDYLLLFKLVLTPVFIGVVSWFARRFGARAGGWLAGFPLTSGPISIFLALEQGEAFAARAAPSTILGIMAVAPFCLVWTLLARRGLGLSYASALLAYIVAIPLVIRVPATPAIALGSTLGVLLLALLSMPPARAGAATGAPPVWDIPVRMAVATGLVVLITGIAHLLGPGWTGLLSPFPIFASVLAAFHYRHEGPEGAIAVLRGILTGVIAFCSFFFVVAIMLPQYGILPTYLTAAACAILVNGINGLLLRHAMPVLPTDAEP